MNRKALFLTLCAAAVLLTFVPAARAEVILQYFNTSWSELADKMPELAEAGYGALWLPPPTKGSGGLSVGYDLWDPFDLGGQDQRSTVKTRYGTEQELIRLIEVAHRFGLRVYFDNIMNHRAFDVPGYNESTPIDTYPGLVPEDFHLRVTADGFYRKWDNVGDWQDAWQVQNRNFSDLIDIAQETPNANFGATEGSTHSKVSFVRQPTHPEFYDYHPTLGRVGFYSTNITAGLIASNGSFYSEDVGGYLMRSVRWLVDHTKVDGLRLDAVKHVPSYFYGDQGGGYSGDTNSAGYCGTAQEQFNVTRVFLDPNHRDSAFDTELPRNDLMMFGEHLGAPPSFSEYVSAGMRLVDSQLKGELNGRLGNPSSSLYGLDTPGWSGNPAFNQFTGVMFAKSHDDDYSTRPELQYAYYTTRQGLPNIYTDGNHQSETLAQSGGAFPRHANTAFLGQFGDNRIPNLVYIHEHFARGNQAGKLSDADVVAYDRTDDRENDCMDSSDPADAAVLSFMMCDNYSAGQYREIPTSFPVGAYLWQYSTGGGNFYYTVPSDRKIKVTVPPGGYFAFSWRSPEESDLWKNGGGKPVAIYENGQECGWVSYMRNDGPDGDPAFNPLGVTDANATDYAYTYYVPRVTAATNVTFVGRFDGSAYNALFKLDGGIDLNGQAHYLGDLRDHPPGIFYDAGHPNDMPSVDMYLGYEQANFMFRQQPEKFAAKDSARNTIGSTGCETYQATIGSSTNVTVNNGSGSNDWSRTYTAEWVYHEPSATITASNQPAQAHFNPSPQNAINSNIAVWVKIGYGCDVNKVFLYYTTDGSTWPEGAGGSGVGNTRVVELSYITCDQATNSIDWWKGTIPAMASNTVLRYKIGASRRQGPDWACAPSWDCPFPSDAPAVARKMKMMGVWGISNFNAATIAYRPHNDYGTYTTGLVEGFHVLRARAFLQRDGSACGNGRRASIYNTFVQSFYFDASTPTGAIIYPQNDYDDLMSQEYGLVVRSDPTVREVWYNVQDSSAANDDGQTGLPNGNGTNAAGQAAWAQAWSEVASPGLSSVYPQQWRFTYRNIPAAGVSTIRVKLCELSSSTNLNLTDSAGHYTTLQRLADARSPTQELYVAYPSSDADQVNDQWDYVMKAWFSKSMDSSTTNFVIRINGSAQAQSDYSIHYDVDGTHHELAFTLPDLFNGDSNFVHHVEVVYTSNGGVQYEAHRYIRVYSQASGPYVSIVSPPEVDSDGKSFVIVLPDVGSPTAEQRQYPVQVDTDLSGSNVWIEFSDNAGVAIRPPSVETPIGGVVDVALNTNLVVGRERALTGTVSVNFSNNLVTGTGSAFTNELRAGHRVRISTNSVAVTQVVSSTQFYIDPPYPGPSVTNVAAAAVPSFNTELQVGSAIRISSNALAVSQILSATNLTLTAAYPGTTATGLTGYRVDGNPLTAGNRRHWYFLWTNMSEGYFTFHARVDTNGVTNTVEASATRNATVVFRQVVTNNPADEDDDDDGIYDYNEETPTNLPGGNTEDWQNGQVHIYNIYGKTDALSPDTDGDELPDGLESGWRGPISSSQTDTNADTDGDGWKNFITDQDPPFYNTLDNHTDGGSACTVPGVKSRTEGGDRSQLIRGNMTDPTNPDSDYDGIPDGIEDWNRNGWLDGDGSALGAAQDKCTRSSWPDATWDSSWTETDPKDGDTDNDSASDGAEDADHNGWIAGDANSNRAWTAGELWTESNPLNPDTDGDGLPDGWEVQYGFDPLDDGVVGHTNLRTGAIIATNLNGAGGNPDGDVYVIGLVTNSYSNVVEYANGTNPRQADTGEDPPAGTITIGRGRMLGVINNTTNYEEFTDWTWDDLIVLDEYEGDGGNNQGGDIYAAWDGWDTSRDIVAFYARDGGAVDGKFYFRVDLHDLQAYAEDANLDLYVVIDTGNPLQGEVAMPRYETEDVDLGTSNRWEAVVVVDSGNKGSVFVDGDRLVNNTVNLTQDPASFGVVERNQTTANGFIAAYFNSELDSVEFSISRQALLDAGWNGLSATSLNYQVFTTKDGTCNGCSAGAPGAGDIGGRNDVRDTIYDDGVAEDYWQYNSNLASVQNVLGYWFSGGNRAGRAKVASVIHGNQAIQPGNIVQNLINNGGGAGYHRPLAVHDVYAVPVNLHITPTLASAIQWARVDTNLSATWRDGPTFNAWIRELAQTNTVHLLASTFADHILPYFTYDYNRDNIALANEFLYDLYGVTVGTGTVFWTPERVLDADVFAKILDAGFRYTLVDQNTHLYTWLGRTTSLSDGGYRINRIEGVNCFSLNNDASIYRFSNDDGGLNLSLRGLFSRRARSGTQDQVVTLLSNWEDFGTLADADAYDANVRWMANHPWTAIVALDDIARGQVDLNHDGGGDGWYVENRGSGVATNKLGHDYIQHAAQGNYDNWYVGSAQEESLETKTFSIRAGTNVNQAYGMLYSPGLITQTWRRVAGVAETNLGKLARGALHASTFETAFHSEDNSDLERFSIGTYVNPDTTYDSLAGFSKQAQAQSRIASIYERVDNWLTFAAGVTSSATATYDADLDGEVEYLLYNDRLFAVFDRVGGRLIAAWVRDILSGQAYQALGNPIGFAGAETEEEGAWSVETNGTVVAYRTSGLKDWWAINTNSVGTPNYVNALYTFTDLTNGWSLLSTDGAIGKRVTLAGRTNQFEVSYQLRGTLTNGVLYVRHGLAPDLYDLLLHGQATLGDPVTGGGTLRLENTNYAETVRATIGYADAGHAAGYNSGAVDDDPGNGVSFYTVNMRNQAQTHQVELVGTNTFSFSLGFAAVPSDWDSDGMPNTYEDAKSFSPTNSGDGTGDADFDTILNWQEYVANTDPRNGSDYLSLSATRQSATGIVVRFPTKTQRDYFVWYVNASLRGTSWTLATTNGLAGTGGTYEWVDNGTQTTPSPLSPSSTSRFYRIQVDLPK